MLPSFKDIMTQPSQHWKPFSLTHVTYPRTTTSSVVSPLLALLSLAPPFGTCALVVSSVVHRDVVSAYLLVGAMSAVTLTSVLKGIIKQPRPPRYDDDLLLSGAAQHREYGMPSNHSCFVWFVAAFVYLHVTRGGASWSARSLPSRSIRLSSCDPSTPPSSSSSSSSSTSSSSSSSTAVADLYRHLQSTVVVASSLVVATGCAYSRVYLGYHTIPQVVIGSALGSSLGAAWYALFETAAVRSYLVRWDGMMTDLEGARVASLLSSSAGGEGDIGGKKRE